MTTSSKKLLIVNADDFGLSPGINRGILHAHEKGIVTSTSVMVRWPAAAESASVVRSHPKLSMGLHVDLGEWIFRDGQWVEFYQVLGPGDVQKAETVQAEVERQLAAFRSIVGTNPSHLDSHQHVHRSEPVLSILKSLAADLKIPLRHFDSRVRYCGEFYGQCGKGEPYPDGITVENLLKILQNLPAGVTEFCCHPGYADDIVSQYRLERAIEAEVLCNGAISQAIAELGIELASFESLAPALQFGKRS